MMDLEKSHALAALNDCINTYKFLVKASSTEEEMKEKFSKYIVALEKLKKEVGE